MLKYKDDGPVCGIRHIILFNARHYVACIISAL